MEDRLAAALRQAETPNHAKTAFLANMSHEIRTPMTAILGFADILEEDPAAAADPVQRGEAVRTIRANARHLLQVRGDILDIAKVEAGRLEIESIDADPVRLVAEAVSLMGSRAEGIGIVLESRCEGLLPPLIRTEPTRPGSGSSCSISSATRSSSPSAERCP